MWRSLISKQQLCTSITYFCTFLWRQGYDNDVKLLNFTFHWECNTRQLLSFLFFLTEIQTLRTQLEKKSLTFDKFSVIWWDVDSVAVVVARLSSLLKLSTQPSGKSVSLHRMYKPEFSSRVSSVGRAFDCRVGSRGFDSWGRTNTQGLKITEKWRYFLYSADGQTFAWLEWQGKMAVTSPVADVNNSVPN